MPEYLVGKALDDWLSARWKLNEFRDWTRSDGTEWGRVHGYYVNLGGFILDFTELKDVDNLPLGDAKRAKVLP